MTVVCLRGLVMAGSIEGPLDREKGTTPARRAISCSPSCQCIASAARHGMAISSATFAHISALNLVLVSIVSLSFSTSLILLMATNLSYSLASLFFRSSSHSLLRSR